MSSVTKKAFAKINLGLEILDKVDNEYIESMKDNELIGLYQEDNTRHYLRTHFYHLQIFDTVTVSNSEKDEIITKGKYSYQFPKNKAQSLAYKTLQYYKSICGIDDNFTIELEMNVLNKSGLGISSMQSAKILQCLDEISGNILGKEKLFELSANLGSDMSFGLIDKPCIGIGYGQLLKPSPLSFTPIFVLATFDNGFSTSLMYQELSKNPSSKDTRNRYFNSFTKISEEKNSSISKIKTLARKYNPITTEITGKGPTVYTMFDMKNEKNALDFYNELSNSKLCDNVILTR